MKLLKTLGLALCLAFLFITLSSKAQVLEPGQVYTTGNIVQNTPYGGPTPWVNGVYQNNLTCWSWGDPGYCGPNAIVRPGNNINFSYGFTDLYQSQAIASVLSTSGSALRVNGYNFGFTAKNGNGWDDGRVDSLSAYVHFTNSAGQVVEYNTYNLNYKFNWTTFNYSETFNTPYAVKDLGNVTYGFYGYDKNGWAGPYGPEINNVSFSLKYSVDPCATNVLSSPTCPGYLEALAKLAPAPIAPNVVTEIAPPPSPAPLPGSPPPPPPGSPAPQDSSQPQPQQGGPALAGSPLPGPSQQVAISQPTANNPQPKVGEVSDSAGSSKTTVSLSSVLSMISSNQEKTAALEKSVTQAADAQAFSAGETAKQTAEKIAGDAQTQSIAIGNSQTAGTTQSSSTQSFSVSGQNSGVALQGNLKSNTVFNSARLEQSLSGVSTEQSTSSLNTNMGIQQNTQNDTKQDFVFNVPQTIAYVPKIDSSNKLEVNTNIQMPKYETPSNNENLGLQLPASTLGRTQFEIKQDTQSTSQTPILPPVKYEPPKVEVSTAPSIQVQQYQPPVVRQEFTVAISTSPMSYSLVAPTRQAQQIQIEMPTLEGIKFGHKGPVDNAMESKPFVPQMNMGPQQNDTVKRNVQNNEAAGNVTLESIAKQPANYAQYFNAIPDVAFYAPKEIYKNQKTIDNARALRQLSSDRLHQEMVNQQYK